MNVEQKDHLAFLLTRGKGEQKTAMPRGGWTEEEESARAIEVDMRRKEDGYREEGKKRGGSPGEDEGGDRRRLQRERKREKEGRERQREPSTGPKAAKEPLKKTA